MMTPRACALAMAGCALMAASAQALAFADNDARKAILELREKVKTLQASQMQLAGQIEQLQAQNAALTGKVEKLTNQLTLQQRSARDLDQRLQTVEPQTQTVDGEAVTVQPEEKRRFDTALELFREGDYDSCKRMLEALMADFPKTGYMPAAYYWIGNALFARGNSEAAVAMHNKMIRLFPDHAKVPDAMLAKAAALASLGRKKEAASTLAQVQKKFPGTEAAKLAADRQKGLR